MMVNLGDVASINPRLSDTLQQTEFVSFVPMASLSAEEARVVSTETRAYSEVSKGYTPFRNGDILVAKITPCFENGKIAQARLPHPNGFGSTEFHVIRPKDSRLDGRYLHHLLRQEHIRVEGERRMTGSGGQRRVPASFLSSLRIFLPHLEEQRRIAAILDQADALRAKRREALTLLDELQRGIFIEMFGDPADNPMDWPLTRLDSICVVGSSKRVFVEELEERGVPFYRGTEIGQLGDGEAVTPSLFISREHYERLKAEAGVPRKGDLLLPSICPDGRIYLVDTDEPFYFKDARVLWIKVNQSVVNSLFLRHYLKLFFAKNYSQVASGTTFAELKIFALKGLDIQSPPIEMQRRFASLARSVETQRENLKSSYGELNKLFESLQHRAFRGEP